MVNQESKKREFVWILLLCMLCLASLAIGTKVVYDKNKNKSSKQEKLLDLNETKDKHNVKQKEMTDEKQTTVDENQGKVVNGEVNKKVTNQNTPEEESSTLSGDNGNVSEQNDNSNGTLKSGNETGATINSNLTFNEDSKIKWPVAGDVILDYNMDNTIYFPTLDSYKCNPAMIIQGDDGETVISGTKACVKTIGEDAEIGKYIVMDVGSGYEITYGQLKDISVSEGQVIEMGEEMGKINSPTKYYIKEGFNLYMKLTKDGKPCDPLDFMD